MRTRRSNYPSPSDGMTFYIKPLVRSSKKPSVDANERPNKMSRVTRHQNDSESGMNALPDDLLVSIIALVASTASSPADLVNAMLTCRRFCAAATHSLVLARAASPALEVKAGNWSDGAHQFLKHCAHAGNAEACYILGMIRFYCLDGRNAGSSLMAKASMAGHTSALYSLAIIKFNGSGGVRRDKDLKAGVALCIRAASLGHVDAMRELGHCLQDGYGVRQNVLEGRRLLLEANAREAAAAVLASPRSFIQTLLRMTTNPNGSSLSHHILPFHSMIGKAQVIQRALMEHPAHTLSFGSDADPIFTFLRRDASSLLSDFGCSTPPPKLHAANRFLVDWFSIHPPPPGLRMCSYGNCGRLETRKHEFRRCSVCGAVNYCSRACQALDWKVRHKYRCRPVGDLEVQPINVADLQALL